MNFDFEIPVSFFEKAEAEDKKKRRIGGIVSCETRDRQDETILQRGLNFDDFLHNGWFNDNHSKKTVDILGYPEVTQYIKKGHAMPNGQVAKADGHWVEGYLLDTPEADKVWELGKALQKTNRRLGFSVEGKILKRSGDNQKTIAKAMVRNVAITNCPVNTDSRMEILAKSLVAVENSEPDGMEKALGMGHPVAPGDIPVGVKTGPEAGQVLTPESLEQKKVKSCDEDDEKKKKVKKSLTGDEAFGFLCARLPQASEAQVQRIIQLARRLKSQGQL